MSVDFTRHKTFSLTSTNNMLASKKNQFLLRNLHQEKIETMGHIHTVRNLTQCPSALNQMSLLSTTFTNHVVFEELSIFRGAPHYSREVTYTVLFVYRLYLLYTTLSYCWFCFGLFSFICHFDFETTENPCMD